MATKTKTAAKPGRAMQKVEANPRKAKANSFFRAKSKPGRLRERLGMNREEFSRLVGVSVRALADAEGGQKEIRKLTRPYNEIERLCYALADVVEADAIGPWLQTPNKQFGGLKPLEVVERGEIDRLWQMVYLLQSGTPS